MKISGHIQISLGKKLIEFLLLWSLCMLFGKWVAMCVYIWRRKVLVGEGSIWLTIVLLLGEPLAKFLQFEWYWLVKSSYSSLHINRYLIWDLLENKLPSYWDSYRFHFQGLLQSSHQHQKVMLTF
jgi:hypothetical protein